MTKDFSERVRSVLQLSRNTLVLHLRFMGHCYQPFGVASGLRNCPWAVPFGISMLRPRYTAGPVEPCQRHGSGGRHQSPAHLRGKNHAGA